MVDVKNNDTGNYINESASQSKGTVKKRKKNYYKKTAIMDNKLVFVISIFFLVAMSVVSFLNMLHGIFSGKLFNMNQVSIIIQIVLPLSIVVLTFILISLYTGDNPFKKRVYQSFNLLGYAYIILSFILPRLEGYVHPSFQIIDIGPFHVYYWPSFLAGLILLCFGTVFKEAYRDRKENDEII